MGLSLVVVLILGTPLAALLGAGESRAQPTLVSLAEATTLNHCSGCLALQA